ncbi:MAG: iron ABC transporter permease [Desulfovibrio sp.]|jgi:iron(III) transport system permease protein|nr:iron ABC transporter permease [Desulfovibrio sp.]
MHGITMLCMVMPFFALVSGVFSPASEHWLYVRDHMLPGYLLETVTLTLGAGVTAFVLGVVLAWCVSMYDFPGRKIFDVLLILPLAIPPYIAAYAYEGLMGYTGAVQSVFRNSFGVSLHRITTDIPAMAWGVWIFAITLFPYVYLLSRAFLQNQSAAVFENARLLGGGELRVFRLVGLPLLWPAATAGTILVCLEVLNDFGVTSYYGLTTFTTAIFSAWFGMGDADTAVKLSLILLALVFFALVARKAVHNARRYHIVSSKEKRMFPCRVSGRAQTGIVLLCCPVCVAGFTAPLCQMLYWLNLTWHGAFTGDLYRALAYTLGSAGAATLLVMVAAICTVNANRLFGGKIFPLLSQGAILGYAVPSAVLAMGAITLFVGLDKCLAVMPIALAPLAASGSMLIYAYAVRFFSIGHHATEAGFAKIGMVYTEASRTLGRSVTRTFFLVDLPLVRHALFSGAVLVFMDILKELPLGLLLRPFNTETLGTWTYHFANNEVLEETALPSLCIILAGAIFILITRFLENREARHVSRY